MLKQFNLTQIKEGNLGEVTSFAQQSLKERNLNNVLSAVDFACLNDTYMSEFTRGFNHAWGRGANVQFKALDEDQIMKQYDVTQSTIQVTIATTVYPTIERLIRSNEILSMVQIKTVKPIESVQLYDFDQEQDAAILSEVAAGTDVDEVLRTGDLLTANNKIQASMRISEFAIATFEAYEMGIFVARLARRVETRLITAILQNGAGAANGTARGNNIRGILNNYGVNGTGDAANAIGAISFATRAATDTAITTAGGVASTDVYDLCLKVKALLLPSNITDAEEDDWVFIMNRNSWGAVRTVLDSTGRAKARSQMDPSTGKVQRTIDGSKVIIAPLVSVPNNRVYLVNLKLYKLILGSELMNLNDAGIVQMREGIISFVSRIWASGSMEYGQRFRPTTAITIGTTAPDNADQNAFRVFNLV